MRRQITLSIVKMMASPEFRAGVFDGRLEQRWAREYEQWDYPAQLGYEWGRVFGVLYGDKASGMYDDDGEPRQRAEAAMLKLLQAGMAI